MRAIDQLHTILIVIFYPQGMDVTVEVKNGAVYDGILHTCRPENSFGLILRHAKQTKPPAGETHKAGVLA